MTGHQASRPFAVAAVCTFFCGALASWLQPLKSRAGPRHCCAAFLERGAEHAAACQHQRERDEDCRNESPLGHGLLQWWVVIGGVMPDLGLQLVEARGRAQQIFAGGGCSGGDGTYGKYGTCGAGGRWLLILRLVRPAGCFPTVLSFLFLPSFPGIDSWPAQCGLQTLY